MCPSKEVTLLLKTSDSRHLRHFLLVSSRDDQDLLLFLLACLSLVSLPTTHMSSHIIDVDANDGMHHAMDDEVVLTDANGNPLRSEAASGSTSAMSTSLSKTDAPCINLFESDDDDDSHGPSFELSMIHYCLRHNDNLYAKLKFTFPCNKCCCPVCQLPITTCEMCCCPICWKGQTRLLLATSADPRALVEAWVVTCRTHAALTRRGSCALRPTSR